MGGGGVEGCRDCLNIPREWLGRAVFCAQQGETLCASWCIGAGQCLCVLHSSLRDQIVKKIISSSSSIEYSCPYSLTHSTYNHDDGLARASLCVLHSSLRDQIVKKIISSSSRIEYSSPYSLTHSNCNHDDVLARVSLCVLHSSLRDQIVKEDHILLPHRILQSLLTYSPHWWSWWSISGGQSVCPAQLSA